MQPFAPEGEPRAPSVRNRLSYSRPRSSRAGTNLPPLTAYTEVLDEPDLESSPVLPGSTGHVGVIRSIRRSAPAAPWERLLELAAPEAGWGTPTSPEQGSLLRPPMQNVRVRRSRRAADYGACLGNLSNDINQRSRSMSSMCRELRQSCSPAEAAGAAAPMTAREAQASRSAAEMESHERAASVPPTGTLKSDDEAKARAKARAISALQRLFFEEMAKGGQDANSAAAAALRRLSEAPQDVALNSTASATSSSGVEQAGRPGAAGSLYKSHFAQEVGQQEEHVAPYTTAAAAAFAMPIPVAPSAAPAGPRRPPPLMHRRRPMPRVAVQN